MEEAAHAPDLPPEDEREDYEKELAAVEVEHADKSRTAKILRDIEIEDELANEARRRAEGADAP